MTIPSLDELASKYPSRVACSDLRVPDLKDDQYIVFTHYRTVKTITEALTGIFIGTCEEKFSPLTAKDILGDIDEARTRFPLSFSSVIRFPPSSSRSSFGLGEKKESLLDILMKEGSEEEKKDAGREICLLCEKKISSFILAKMFYDAFLSEMSKAIFLHIKREKPNEFYATYLLYLLEMEKKQQASIVAWIWHFHEVFLSASRLADLPPSPRLSVPNFVKKSEQYDMAEATTRDATPRKSWASFLKKELRKEQKREEQRRRKEEALRVPIPLLYERETGRSLRFVSHRYCGLCPFHEEKTPSFFVFDDNHYHCFGCGAHGNSIDFLINIRHISYKEAIWELTTTIPLTTL